MASGVRRRNASRKGRGKTFSGTIKSLREKSPILDAMGGRPYQNEKVMAFNKKTSGHEQGFVNPQGELETLGERLLRKLKKKK